MRRLAFLAWALAAWRAATLAAMTDRTQVIALLNAFLRGAAWPALPTSWKLMLGSTVPANTARMTESAWTGYTPGGQAITTAAVTTANPPIPASLVSWTNSSGTAQTIAGLEVVDNNAVRWLEGPWAGQPVTLNNGNVFQVAGGAIIPDATGW